MQSFKEATSWARTDAGVYTGVIDPSWYQGRGAFGGLLGGAILRGLMRTVEAPARIPRSLTVHFCAPAVAGPLELHTRVERTGSSVTHASARLLQQGEPVCLATATFAQARKTGLRYADARMPDVAPAHDVPPVPSDLPMFPVFARNHFEYRFAGTSVPYSSSPEARLDVWLQPRAREIVDAPMAVGLLDAPPPAVLARLDRVQAAATVDLTIHFFHALPLPDDDGTRHHLVAMRSRQGADGYTEQLAELWTADGTLIAQCRQLVALLG